MRIIYITVFFLLAVLSILYINQVVEYNEQSEYEANHPILPIKNISGTNHTAVFNASALESFKINASRTYFIKVYDESSRVILIRANNGSDYTNSTIEINMSYIKETRQENNTMIVSIRR